MEEQVTRYATPQEQRIIQKILKITNKMRTLAADREKAYHSLSKCCGDHTLICEIEIDGITETRTFKVGQPKGKYVVYATLDFLINRRVSKADNEALAENLEAQSAG